MFIYIGFFVLDAKAIPCVSVKSLKILQLYYDTFQRGLRGFFYNLEPDPERIRSRITNKSIRILKKALRIPRTFCREDESSLILQCFLIFMSLRFYCRRCNAARAELFSLMSSQKVVDVSRTQGGVRNSNLKVRFLLC
jgi:hypothetical protein